MFSNIVATTALLLALAAKTTAKSVWATPHDKYSSSVGVLGCKIDTNRVAYWPGSIDCDNICVKLSYEGRSVHLLRIDQSGGAHDVSYDAWAYLQTGKSATDKPITGGGVAMEYEEVDASECADLINTPGNKLPLSASNSINYLTSCLDQPDSWVAKNHLLYNICDAICTLGYDEKCSLDLDTSNQPSCPHTLGLQTELTTAPVHDIEYESGRTVKAGTSEVVESSDDDGSGESEDSEDPEPESVESYDQTETVLSTYTGGVFAEDGSSTIPIVQTTAELVLTAPVASPTVQPTSSPSLDVPENPTVIPEISSVSTEVPATAVSPSSFSSFASSNTMTTVTVSTSSSTPIGTPSSTPTGPPDSAGHSLAHIPFLTLFSCLMLVLIIG